MDPSNYVVITRDFPIVNSCWHTISYNPHVELQNICNIACA